VDNALICGCAGELSFARLVSGPDGDNSMSGYPMVQVQACGGERAFGVDHVTAVLHAVADRPLVNIQSDVIRRLRGEPPWCV
jgi:hypothetical protein